MSGKFPTEATDDDPCGLLALADQLRECGQQIDQSALVERLSASSWRSRALYLRHVAKMVRDWALET